MRPDAGAQVLSIDCSDSRGYRTRPPHQKRTVSATAQGRGKGTLAEEDVGLCAKSGERVGFAGRHLISANAPDLTEDETREGGRVSEARVSSSSLSEEDFIWR